MTLDEYLDGRESMRDFAKRSKVSYATVKAVCRGMKLSKYRVAKKISDATRVRPDTKIPTIDPSVSIQELCE